MGDPSISGLTDEDINFKASDNIKEAGDTLTEGTKSQKTDQVIKSILSGEMPSTSDFPLASHPDLNRLGTHILRIIYPKLTERPKGIDRETSNNLLDRKREFLSQFAEQVKETGLPLKYWRERGESCFHLGNEKGIKSIEDGFAYYFNKSRAEWRPYEGEIERAYLTIRPELATETPQYFVELVNFLRDAGVDFYAKAGSPWHAAKRLDDFVFYISPNDVDRTRELFRDYIGDQEIFKGTVLSAKADKSIEGLSWGKEPTEEETEEWQKATGDHRGISYSQALAFKMAPSTFEAIAKQYNENGQMEEGAKFESLAKQAQDALSQKRANAESNSQRQDVPKELIKDEPEAKSMSSQDANNPSPDEMTKEKIAPLRNQEVDIESQKLEQIIAKNRKFLEAVDNALGQTRRISNDVPLSDPWSKSLSTFSDEGLTRLRNNILNIRNDVDDLGRVSISIGPGEKPLNIQAKLKDTVDQLAQDWKIFERNTQDCLDLMRRLDSKARELTGDRFDRDHPVYKIATILTSISEEHPNIMRSLN